LLPAIACFLAAVAFHGTPATADAVNDSWLPLWRITDPADPAIHEPATAIEGLGWSSGKGLSLALFMLTSGFYQPMAWAMVFAIAFAIMLLFTGRPLGQTTPAAMNARVELTSILLLQLLFLSPLFLLGVDYGRWLFFWTASSIILHIQQRRAPAWMEAAVKQAFEAIHLNRILHRIPASDWLLFIIGVPVCWNLQAFLHSSPAGRLWFELSHWF
jgi:hypothetical protein